MIVNVDDVLKVNVEDYDEGLFAKVIDVNDKILVKYFVPTNKLYKNATIYEFENKINTIDNECILEQYEGWTLDDFGVKNIKGDHMFIFESDINSDFSDSDIEELEDDSDTNSFMTDDEGNEFPCDSAKIDEDWNKWKPKTTGEKIFKKKIDELEARYRHMNDDF